jgi:hypothetical protein
MDERVTDETSKRKESSPQRYVIKKCRTSGECREDYYVMTWNQVCKHMLSCIDEVTEVMKVSSLISIILLVLQITVLHTCGRVTDVECHFN